MNYIKILLSLQKKIMKKQIFKANYLSIVNIPSNKGIYFFYLKKEGLKELSKFCEIEFSQNINDEINLIEIDNIQYQLIYIGTAGTGKNKTSNLIERLSWHLCQKHGVSEITNGILSTLRLGLSSLLCNDLMLPNTQLIVNEFLENYCYFTFEVIADENLIETKEKELIEKYKPILNLKNNPSPNLNYKKRRSEVRKKTLARLMSQNSNIVINDDDEIDNNEKLTEFYFVPCCSKKDTQSLSDNFSNKPLSFDEELKEHRNTILSALIYSTKHIRKKNDVTINVQNYINLKQKASAHLFYNGRFYNAASAKYWTKEQTSKIYIISALFGIIRADDYIFNYDLAMEDKLISPNYLNGQEFTPKDFWKGKLDNLIQKFISENNAIIYNLLSDNYLDILEKNDLLQNPPIDFDFNDRNARSIRRGEWIANHLGVEFTNKNTNNRNSIENIPILNKVNTPNKEFIQNLLIDEIPNLTKINNEHENIIYTVGSQKIKDKFIIAIKQIINHAIKTGNPQIDISARMVEDISGIKNRLPACCNAMRNTIKTRRYNGEIISDDRDHKGFTIRYYLI